MPSKKDERRFETSYTLAHRLRQAAVENRQAVIKGMPHLETKEAEGNVCASPSKPLAYKLNGVKQQTSL